MQLIGECCNRKPLNEVCGECRLDLMVFFLENKNAVTRYLRTYDYKLLMWLENAEFKL